MTKELVGLASKNARALLNEFKRGSRFTYYPEGTIDSSDAVSKLTPDTMGQFHDYIAVAKKDLPSILDMDPKDMESRVAYMREQSDIVTLSAEGRALFHGEISSDYVVFPIRKLKEIEAKTDQSQGRSIQ